MKSDLTRIRITAIAPRSIRWDSFRLATQRFPALPTTLGPGAWAAAWGAEHLPRSARPSVKEHTEVDRRRRGLRLLTGGSREQGRHAASCGNHFGPSIAGAG